MNEVVQEHFTTEFGLIKEAGFKKWRAEKIWKNANAFNDSLDAKGQSWKSILKGLKLGATYRTLMPGKGIYNSAKIKEIAELLKAKDVPRKSKAGVLSVIAGDTAVLGAYGYGGYKGGKKAYQYYKEKRAAAEASLGVTTKPRDLGIYSRKEDTHHRALAYSHKLPQAAMSGVALGGAAGAFNEGSMWNLASEEGRAKISRGVTHDLTDIVGNDPKHAAKILSSPTGYASGLAMKAYTGRGMSAGDKATLEALKRVGGRRAGLALKGVASGVATAVGFRALKNLSDYETAHALTPTPSEIARAKKRRSQRNKQR